MSSTPIADYALLSDCISAALVSRGGSIDWLCLGRFDAPATFARLLDDAAGYWCIRPAGEHAVRRRYLPETLVLETTFETASGVAVLTDAMAVGPLDYTTVDDGPQTVLRRIECIDGAVDIEIEFVPRPEFGLVHPILDVKDGCVRGRGGAINLLLSSSVPLHVDDSVARARFTLRRGAVANFSLRHSASWEKWPVPLEPDAVAAALDRSRDAWVKWSRDHRHYDGPWRELVDHSGRVLRALTFEATGAVIAAPTTSLPEAVGHERNWDYRYTWIRDASFTLDALGAHAGSREATRYFSFLATAALAQLQRGSDLQIVFGIGGERDLSERELAHLAGWRGSRPVRVGNAAWRQRQLDVYGELFAAAHRFGDDEIRRQLNEEERKFLASLADITAAHWTEEDHGLWEIRGPMRHYVYSKMMCWVALDRAIAMADALGAADHSQAWCEARRDIHRAILERGWSDRAGAFAQAFGSDALDASNLMMAIVGFLPPDDRRLRATVAAIAERLVDKNGLVYRYRNGDGLEGDEGTFLLCTFWLAHAQVIFGDVAAARQTFERAISHANDVGLLSEEVSAETGELLGNFPQAFSHMGLINAARAIATGEHRPRRMGTTSKRA